VVTQYAMMRGREVRTELARLVMASIANRDGLGLVPEYYIDQAQKRWTVTNSVGPA
jgi:hypothetical protein